MSDPRQRVAVALDVASAAQAMSLLDTLGDRCSWVKVGMELFYAEGPGVVRQMRDRGLQVFLDLKLHDIPNTVAHAVQALARHDVQLLTVHAQGGREMLQAAQQATTDWGGPKLLAVTVLTSMDDATLPDVGIEPPASAQVSRLARLAMECGLHGLVCSPLETALLRQTLGDRPFIVTPGIRQTSSAADDQKRTASVESAIRSGSSMLVVGRPVTRASDPAAALDALLEEVARATA